MIDIISSLTKGGIEGIFSSAGELAKDIRMAITGEINPDEKAKLEHRLVELEFLSRNAQAQVNMQEAKHPNWFIAGWRPGVGWTCVLGIFIHYIVNPLFHWYIIISGGTCIPPKLDMGDLLVILGSMLGFGILRRQEKKDGTQGKH